MNAQNKRLFQLALASLALGLLAVGLSQAQSGTPSSESSRAGFLSTMGSFEPIVETGQSELGGRHVFVHLPGIFDLKLDTRANSQGARISQTVLSGLVSIELDRVRDRGGRLSGPIDVRVLGLPVYRNEAARNGKPAIPKPTRLSELTPSIDTES